MIWNLITLSSYLAFLTTPVVIASSSYQKHDFMEKLFEEHADKVKKSTTSFKTNEAATPGWITATFAESCVENAPLYEIWGVRTEVCVPDPIHDLKGSKYTCSKSEDTATFTKHHYSDDICDEGSYIDSSFLTLPLACVDNMIFDCSDSDVAAYTNYEYGYIQKFHVDSTCSSMMVKYGFRFPGCFADSENSSGGQGSEYYWCDGSTSTLGSKTYRDDATCSAEYCSTESRGLQYCIQQTGNANDPGDDVMPQTNYPLYATEYCIGSLPAHTDLGQSSNTCYDNDGGNNDNDGGNNDNDGGNIEEQLVGTHYGYCVQTAYSNKDGSKAHCLAQDNRHQRNVLSYTYTAQFKNGKYRYETGVGAGVENDHLRTYAPYRSDWMDYTVSNGQYGQACVQTEDGATFVVDFNSGFYHESGVYSTQHNTAGTNCQTDTGLHCDEYGQYGYECRAMEYRGKSTTPAP